jgi:hypothetical protein
MNMSRRTAATLIAACTMTMAVATACGKDEEASRATAATSRASTPSTPSTSSTSPQTTDVTTSSVAPPPTTPPPVSAAPTTTADLATVQAQVEADYREAVAAFRRAQQDPTDPAAVAEALSWRVEPNLTAITNRLTDMAINNERGLPEPLRDPTITIEVPPVARPGSTTEFEIQTCEIDPWVLVETGTGPGGSDAVIDDNIYAYRNVVRLVLVDGAWRTSNVIEIGNWVGAETCGAS